MSPVFRTGLKAFKIIYILACLCTVYASPCVRKGERERKKMPFAQIE